MGSRTIWATVILITLLIVGIVTKALIGGPEYALPTQEQIDNAAKAITAIDALEKEAETRYFDPTFHGALGLDYAMAFAAHTDNSTYLERTISEFSVSLSLQDNPFLLSLFQRIYTAYHNNRNPKNIFTPNSLSFDKWREFTTLMSPHPDEVRLVINSQSELAELYAQYLRSGYTNENLTMSFQATMKHIEYMFRVATQRELIITNKGRVFLTPAYFREWYAAIHTYGLGSSNGFAVSQSYQDRLPADATLIVGGDDQGCYRVAPNLIVTPGFKYLRSAMASVTTSGEH